MGSPPRVRGKAAFERRFPVGHGITPARAGKRSEEVTDLYLYEDHPRACGEKSSFHSTAAAGVGSPPRVRGKVRDNL